MFRPGDPLAGAKFTALTDAKDALLDPKRREASERTHAARHSTPLPSQKQVLKGKVRTKKLSIRFGFVGHLFGFDGFLWFRMLS